MAANNTAPSGLDKEQIFGMAEKEMEYRVELFNKLTHTCFNKCVDKRYKESELNMGENSCIDRCVFKILACDKPRWPAAWFRETSHVIQVYCFVLQFVPLELVLAGYQREQEVE